MNPPEPILAVYLDDQAQSYQVRLTTSKLPAEGYGIMLFDIVRHVAAMFAKESDFSEEHVKEKILEWFDKERAQPTSEISQQRLQ